METITPTLNSIANYAEPLQITNELLVGEDLAFYESLKPALNQIIINPSDVSINRILAFSKSV